MHNVTFGAGRRSIDRRSSLIASPPQNLHNTTIEAIRAGLADSFTIIMHDASRPRLPVRIDALCRSAPSAEEGA